MSTLIHSHISSRRKAGGASSNKGNPEILVKDLWRRLMEDYGGVEGDVDGQVVVAFSLLCINQNMHLFAKQTIEGYLATIPDGMLIHLETAAGALPIGKDTKSPLMVHYERLVELYVVHILAKLNEWDYAQKFLELNNVLSGSSKQQYIGEAGKKVVKTKENNKEIYSRGNFIIKINSKGLVGT
ncbi:hypothetical protein BGZ76_009330 [Entomortierella beljakovae]|nr:hypothetical protein BGZ76_009330 [Entomortierella beljakovae]